MSLSLDRELADLNRNPSAPIDLDWLSSGDTFAVSNTNNPNNQLPNLQAQAAFNRGEQATDQRRFALVEQTVMSAIHQGFRGQPLRNAVRKSVGDQTYDTFQGIIEPYIASIEGCEREAIAAHQQQLLKKAVVQAQTALPQTTMTNDTAVYSAAGSDLTFDIASEVASMNDVTLCESEAPVESLTATAPTVAIDGLDDERTDFFDENSNKQALDVAAVPASLIVDGFDDDKSDEFFDESSTEKEVELKPQRKVDGMSVVLDDELDVTL